MVPSVEPGLVRCCSSTAVMVFAARALADATALEEPAMGSIFASPKSRILACPRWVTKIFAGLMSRWTIPLECAASNPSATSIASESTVSLSSGLPAMRCFSVAPSRNSMAMQRLPTVFADFVDSTNIGMIKRRSRPSLAAKAFQRLRVARQFIGQEFERDKAAKLGVLGFIHDPHAAAAKLFDDAVVRDCLVDHNKSRLNGRFILRRRPSPVNESLKSVVVQFESVLKGAD